MTYSATYISTCESLEAEAAERLGRPLTERERRGIWNAGTLMLLEAVVGQGLHTARTEADVVAVLEQAAAATTDRLPQMIGELSGLVAVLIERDLTADEQARLAHIPDVVQVMQFGEALTAAPDRDSRLRLLADLL